MKKLAIGTAAIAAIVGVASRSQKPQLRKPAKASKAAAGKAEPAKGAAAKSEAAGAPKRRRKAKKHGKARATHATRA